MSTTATKVIKASLYTLGFVAPGQPLSAELAQISLDALNRLIDTWRGSRLNLPREARSTKVLSVGVQAYTIGPGGNFNQARPETAFRASIMPVTTGQAYEQPIPVLDVQEWQAVGVKTLSGTFPTKVYYDRSYPLGTLSVWPIPTTAPTLVLYVPVPLAAFTDMTTSVDLPAIYEEALIYNLAIRMAPMLAKEPSPTIMKLATDTLQAMKRVNSMLEELVVDPALGRSGRPYNWLTNQGG